MAISWLCPECFLSCWGERNAREGEKASDVLLNGELAHIPVLLLLGFTSVSSCSSF